MISASAPLDEMFDDLLLAVPPSVTERDIPDINVRFKLETNARGKGVLTFFILNLRQDDDL